MHTGNERRRRFATRSALMTLRQRYLACHSNPSTHHAFLNVKVPSFCNDTRIAMHDSSTAAKSRLYILVEVSNVTRYTRSTRRISCCQRPQDQTPTEIQRWIP